MSRKKFASDPAQPGFTIVKNDGVLWHLIKIDEFQNVDGLK
jgi:hypothetical protein